MGCMKRDILKEASVQCLETVSVISSTHTLKAKSMCIIACVHIYYMCMCKRLNKVLWVVIE